MFMTCTTFSLKIGFAYLSQIHIINENMILAVVWTALAAVLVTVPAQEQ